MNEARVHITQGEFATSADSGVVISTLLGSCVSCCLWDPQIGVGGMNHILLAQSGASCQARALSGIHAMELLINDLIKQGAARSRLQAKAFGGARMIRGLSDIGKMNSEFTEDFLQQEGIPLMTSSFGGTEARSVRFWPVTGRAQQKLTGAQVGVIESAPTPPIGNSVELF